MIGTAVAVYVAFCTLIVYIRQFDFPWFGGYLNIVIITAGNLLIAGFIIWKLRGKKSDPYQTHEDRLSQIGLVVNQIVLTSIAATTFVAITVTLASLELRHIQPMMSCLYFMVLSVICFHTLRIDNLNFDVYRRNPIEEHGQPVNHETVERTSQRARVIGIGLGLFFGAAVGAEFGESLVSLIGGAGIGAVLGLAIGSRLDAPGASDILVLPPGI